MRRIGILTTVVALALGLGACGDDGSTTSLSRDEFSPVLEPPDEPQRGGTLTVVAAGDVDFLDPGIAYYQFSYVVGFATQRTLLGWPPAETEEPQPDLAESAKISDDFRTLTFKIKPGVRYSPPVNREIRAEDFKYAIERGLLSGVATPYLQSYLGSLVGFASAAKQVERDATTAPEINGIATPDDRTLVFRFNQPVATVARQALSLLLDAGPGGIREAVRRGNSLVVRPASSRDRPVHDREQRIG